MDGRRPKLQLPRDPRIYQISVLAGLFVYGLTALHFEVRPLQAAVLLGTVLATQFVCSKLGKLPAFDSRSALISGLSLCLLLRTNSLWLAVLTAFVTIASKFVLRWNGKHIFNPTNFGLVAMMLATGQVWVSPGQWGNVAFFGFLMACLGGLVVNRAARSDVTYAFAVSYLGILFARALWLGQPLAVPLHQVQNGAFLLFTFFMISDPKTTPDSRIGRMLFAFLVAAGAASVQFLLYRTNGLLWSLAVFSLAVPLIDRWLPGSRYQWARRPASRISEKGSSHETLDPERVPAAVRGASAFGRP
ncbi:MAG TPA: RnfABCDGE type electron transport complex subunit D [Candidatus Limnocylindria bacterium]|nr:RnfABCDGE type electron transport complex subunit D [Candidatus Limnocylindria bacterium]